VYTQIRRFVIVSVKKEFVYAWLVPTLRCCMSFIDIFSPIFTYSKRGTAKPGIDPRHHAIIYMSDTSPETVPGESLSSMKDPIKVIPTNSNERLDRASRLNFGLHHPIQCNVKVKDIGIVAPDDIPKVVRYWRMEMDNEDAIIDKPNLSTYAQPTAPRGYTYAQTAPRGYTYAQPTQSYYTYAQLTSPTYAQLTSPTHTKPNPPSQPEVTANDLIETEEDPAINSYHAWIPRSLSAATGNLSLRNLSPNISARPFSSADNFSWPFEAVRNPKGFFKKGRVFTMSWSKKGQATEKTFVVLRPKGQSADCLPITSSGHEDAESEGSNHAEIIPVEEGEELPTDDYQSKARIFVIIEAKGTSLAPFSRINFGKTHEVAFDGNLVVRNVGRVVPQSIWHLKQYQDQYDDSDRSTMVAKSRDFSFDGFGDGLA
jgi:hypothetical protein